MSDHDAGRALLDAVLADQRRRWQAGERPAVESYLAAHPELAQDEGAVLDLVYQEVFLREEHDKPAQVEEYVQRFPEWDEQIRLQFEIHEAIERNAEPAIAAPPAHRGASPPPGYEFGEEIGRGAIGVVYRARDSARDRTVAVKVLLPEHRDNRPVRKRFMAEARAVTRLAHPHIVTLHEVGETPDGPFLVMELIEGRSLEAALRPGPMAFAEAALTLLPVAEAVDYAHRSGVIHRDLKPSNILLDPRRGPVVLDFGMAKVRREHGSLSLSSWTAPGAILGTPAFMPPEQADADHAAVGPPSDVYSLGAILYAMLTGRPPFAAANVLQTLRMVRSTLPPLPVRHYRPDVPEPLERVCLRCLEKAPEQRYPTAWALAAALRALEPASVLRFTSAAILHNLATDERSALELGSTLVGRAEHCNLVFADPKISRCHCRIDLNASGASVEDLGSGWGTFVNGRRVQQAPLADGDRLDIGGQRLLFRRQS